MRWFCRTEAESTESVIICIHGTKLPSGEETTSSADRSDRSVESGSGVLIHQGYLGMYAIRRARDMFIDLPS
ncbi:hypothetical protein T4D_11364 [Trichinella pseudospiralis]|uniref:Uncharacterized protein n=1 Tax=Trichinella pseudospiralis TaxID=6337 RepID=A0A0V1FIG1_TRIPS|nr:hypothetical protein T4D_11364 [Trichinella pseudospiralis]